MAYIIGLLTAAEAAELKRRGWELEPAPKEMVPAEPLEEGDSIQMVYVDNDMFAVMSGPDWDKGEN
jgi:hypothetical protein